MVDAPNHIGTLTEKSLHAALKDRFSQPGDLLETAVGGYVVDIRRGDEMIEFQTRNFSSIKTKLERLTKQFRVRVVHPIAGTKWIVRIDKAGKEINRRRSPKSGRLLELFNELVYIPDICERENFSLEAVLVEVEEIWRDDGRGSWRRKGWSIADRRLLGITARQRFVSPIDYSIFIPDSLPRTFTNADVTEHLRIRPRLAQKMTYCLREMGILALTGKKGRAYQYTLTQKTTA